MHVILLLQTLHITPSKSQIANNALYYPFCVHIHTLLPQGFLLAHLCAETVVLNHGPLWQSMTPVGSF